LREIINKKESKVLLLYAAVAKPGQSLKETTLGEGLKILSHRGSPVQIRPAAPCFRMIKH